MHFHLPLDFTNDFYLIIIHYQNSHDWTHECCYTPGISAQFLTYFKIVVTAASSKPRIR